MKAAIESIRKAKLIVIVRGLESAHMSELAEALCQGGLRAMEITYNQMKPDTWRHTLSAIRLVDEQFGGRLLVGAGTVLTEAQVEMAAEAGAKYIISPNTDARVIARTKALGLISMPGALTPTEILTAHELGADFVKLFPAGTLGIEYIKAVRAPLSHIPLMAVGGVNEKNAADFLRAGCVGLGVGGGLVNKEWIENGAFDKIEALAREYIKAVEEA